MADFTAYVQSWYTFYAAMVAGSATLMGLIFLAVSLRIDIFNRKDTPEPRQVAWQTFLNFFWVFVVGTTFLIPGTSSVSLGTILSVVGLIGVFMVLRRWWRARRHLTVARALFAFPPLMVCYLGITFGGLACAISSFRFLVLVAPALIFLIGVAVYNAWELLVSYQK